MKIRLKIGFYYPAGKANQPGDVIDVPDGFGQMEINSGRAELVKQEPLKAEPEVIQHREPEVEHREPKPKKKVRRKRHA